jgi:transposase
MKYAQIQVLAETPPGGLSAGIDWGSADHAVCVVDTAGQVRARFTVAHDRAGIAKLIAGLQAAGVSEAAIERSDGVLVEALLQAGLTVVVITSRQMKNLRSRYGSASAKDDRFDAFVLADALRTDRAGLAGVAPVTRRSGKHISIGFRWAVNRQLRDAVCDFAGDSRHASPWAAAIYDAARARGKDHPHAVRITARAWTYVIWRCWQSGTAYDPAKHNALHRVLEQQNA